MVLWKFGLFEGVDFEVVLVVMIYDGIIIKLLYMVDDVYSVVVIGGLLGYWFFVRGVIVDGVIVIGWDVW